MNQIPTIPQNLARIASRIRLPRPVKNEHLTKKFFIVTILFDILWIPYLVKAFVSTLNGSKVSHAVGTILSWITYTQVALCPLIYLFLMKMQGKPKKTVASENSIYQIDSRRL
jgi:hypothetical protein